MLKDWEWSDTLATVGVIAVVCFLALVGVYFFSSKQVDYYYLSHGSGGTGSSAICVYAHWTWHVDEVAFCTDDKDRALDFATRANTSLRGK